MKLWRTKIFAKLVLSRLPFNYRFWSRIGLFRHGGMDEFSYVWKVLENHTSKLDKSNDWIGLELGPGDGLLSAFMAPALGSLGLTLVDTGDFAHKDAGRYHQQITQFLNTFPDVTLPDIVYSHDVNKMLSSVGGRYSSQGLQSLKELKANSFDLIFSQAVLEHVRHKEFKNTMRECHRLLSTNGVMSHVVDFKDHLGGGLNNMRFSSSLWERDWFSADSGFYTNRIKLSEIISICEDVGFVVEVHSIKRWESLPIRRDQLAKEFHDLPEDDLLVFDAHLVMRMQ
jgi:SAM-dependent methyltransferase